MAVQTSTEANPVLRPEGKGWAERILACIDDDAAGAVIIDWLLTLPSSSTREVVLLGLLPKPEAVRSRGILIDTVRQQLRVAGQHRIAAITPAVERAGMSHRDRIELFDGAEDIVACAREERADVIVMVGKPLGQLHRRIATVLPTRSLAARVADMSGIPVVILKQAAPQ
ncbi:MAG: universal stress protein [Hyphomicrobiaceae bacterium]|nr:universal stress protein [Hyphomicrobiaceae bacterium]